MYKRFIQKYFYKMAKDHLNRSNYSNDLEYYRDVTFVKSIIIIHPFTILPTILGINYGCRIGSEPIVLWATVTYLMLILISLPSRITIHQRKLFLTIAIFNFGFQMLVDSGMDASGILYWTIGNIMASFFFRRKNYLLIFILNCCMSVFIGFLIYSQNTSPLFSKSLSLADWLLISVNNIFLSVIISILFTELVQNLHQLIIKQRLLKGKYETNVQTLKRSNHSLETKNNELEQMVYVISHDLQEPIRMIVSFLGRLIEKYKSQITISNQQVIIDSVADASKMKVIVNDLLELSTINIESHVKEVIHLDRLTHELFISKNLEFIPSINFVENRSLYSYKKPITKIIENLIDVTIANENPSKGLAIEVSCSAKNGYWVIKYIDKALHFQSNTNEAISILNVNHFFEDFGYDFTICKLLIDQLNGQLEITTVHNQLIISFIIPV